MAEYIKKFESASAIPENGYPIVYIPFITSVGGDSIQNLHCNLSGKKLVNVNGIIEVQNNPANTKYMLIYDGGDGNIFSSINDLFPYFDEMMESFDAEAVSKLIEESQNFTCDPETGEVYDNTQNNFVFNDGPNIQWDPFLYIPFFQYCKMNTENRASDEVLDIDTDTVIPCLITIGGVDRIVFLYPNIEFEATSENSAWTYIYGVYFDNPNNKNSVHYISIQGSVSIDFSDEDPMIVVGDTHIVGELSGPFDTNAIDKLYNTYIGDSFFQTMLRGGVESGQLTVYSEYNGFASILVNNEVE